MSIPNEKYDYLFKILSLGDSGVGKSALIVRFADDIYVGVDRTTIAADMKMRTFELDGKVIKLQIWDTAGQERFRAIATSFYRGAHGVILAYDVTNRQSFDSVKTWLSYLNDNFPHDKPKQLLVGNKCDLTSQREVSHSEAKEFANLLDIPFLETSAKDNTNVDKAFRKLAQEIIGVSSVFGGSQMWSHTEGSINPSRPVEPTGGKCC